MPFVVMAFLCSLSLSHQECTRETSIDTLILGKARNELACMRDAMQTLGELAIRADAEHYWKITCTRSTIVQGSVG